MIGVLLRSGRKKYAKVRMPQIERHNPGFWGRFILAAVKRNCTGWTVPSRPVSTISYLSHSIGFIHFYILSSASVCCVVCVSTIYPYWWCITLLNIACKTKTKTRTKTIKTIPWTWSSFCVSNMFLELKQKKSKKTTRVEMCWCVGVFFVWTAFAIFHIGQFQG